MMPVNRTDTAIQPGSLVTLDLAPSVVFVAVNAPKRSPHFGIHAGRPSPFQPGACG